MFTEAQAVWDDAYSLVTSNSSDVQQKGSIGSTQSPTDMYSTTVDVLQNWTLGQYIWEFFDSFHPEELFDVKQTLHDSQQDDGKDD